MKKIKKLLYLLQLEEYQTERYLAWLGKHPIDQLKERKGRLHWTLRIILTGIFALPLSFLLGAQQAVASTNKGLGLVFAGLGNLVVLAAQVKLKFHPHLVKVIITGSYGKTTLKEMLASVLAAQYQVCKTPENINTRLGIAQIILKNLKRTHQIMVIEAAAYAKGEIKAICQLFKPSFGIITAIGWMHLERFGTFANIRQTKLELVPFIKDKEKLFIPAKNHQLISFEKTITEIGQKLDLSSSVVKKKLSAFQPPQRRLVTKKVNPHLTVLDDTYNANPLGFKRALATLKTYQGQQKIVATPGMVELGAKQFLLNKQAAQQAVRVADIFVIVGETNKRALSAGAKVKPKESLKIIYLKKEESLDEKLTAHLRPPTVLLLENELPDHYF